jgi:hypothetical protein
MAETEPTALIEELRRANRRWRTIAILEALIVAVPLIASTLFFGVRVERQKARAEMARHVAEQALRAAERRNPQ